MSYKLSPDYLRHMLSKIEEGARSKYKDDALCRIFVLLGSPDIYLIFNSKQHKECLEFLQREVGRKLASSDVAWAGSLELEDTKSLMLESGGGSFGRSYRNDLNVGQMVQTQLSQMLNSIDSGYTLR
jgi:hypothetical protein